MTDLLYPSNPECNALIMKQLLLGLKAYREDKKIHKHKYKKNSQSNQIDGHRYCETGGFEVEGLL